MKLIIGLGNPGEKYQKTRHNAGFMALNAMVAKSQTPNPKSQIKFNSEITERINSGERIIFAKPQTFMNESGKAIKAIIDYHKIDIADIIVIHDDLDIALGKYKIAKNRSSAGHKGVQSIIDNLGTKDFTRIRIGIGVKDKKIPTETFVLENFTEEEQEIIDMAIEKICEELNISQLAASQNSTDK